jgi:aromatic ring-opening dioxygenase catalytic subunit (LigB family)
MEVSPGLPPDLWDRMAAYLRGLDRSLGARPRAVLVISGHWEMEHPTVNTSAQPPLLFDYYGFPAHTYQLKYPAPGSPTIAARVREVLAAAGIDSREDCKRALDH